MGGGEEGEQRREWAKNGFKKINLPVNNVFADKTSMDSKSSIKRPVTL